MVILAVLPLTQHWRGLPVRRVVAFHGVAQRRKTLLNLEINKGKDRTKKYGPF